VPSKPNSFATYRNRDFATIKGMDLGFTLRPTNHIAANIAYSLSFAQGTGSVSQSDRNRAWTASATPKQTAPLDFDQRHKLSANLDWRLQKGEGMTFGGIRPFENTGVNLLFNVASGTPYTPTQVYNEVTLSAVSGVVAGPQNSRYGPWTVNMDLKATKAFALAGFRMEAQMWVLNVFDNENPIAVYTSSGSPFSTNFLGTQDGAAFVTAAGNKGFDGKSFYELAENNPTLFATPRLVRFGIRAAF
jgi:hypothetical protein